MPTARRQVSQMVMAVLCLAFVAAPTWAQAPPLLDLPNSNCAFGWTMDSVRVYLRTGAGDAQVTTIPSGTPQSWSWPCPTTPGIYYVSIAAANGPVEGNRGQAIGFIIEPWPPPAPAISSLGGDLTSNNLVWVDNSPNEKGFRIYRKTEACGGPNPLTLLTETPPNATAYTDTPVTTGSYCYRVTAFNDTGESDPTNPAERTILPTPPPAPVFAIGAHVQVNTAVGQSLNVRAVPNGLPILGTQPKGASGTITDGPTVVSGVTWWKIDYGSGADGWSSQTYLVLAP